MEGTSDVFEAGRVQKHALHCALHVLLLTHHAIKARGSCADYMCVVLACKAPTDAHATKACSSCC
jgi:hypothetical protein